jgi:endonuclease/exonuclease/phosphatase family metal-dependent hydrolase
VKKVALIALVSLAAIAWCRGGDDSPDELRVATFNIENFPKSEGQVKGAFELLAELDVAAVGVQEITDPDVFQRGAHQYMGAHWRAELCSDCGMHRVGVVFDTERLELLSTRSYDDTIVYPGAKPAFEARLRRTDGNGVVRMIVVHLKAGGEHFATRERQLRALRGVLADAAATDDFTILLGDYNATSPDDREAIAALAGTTGTAWASRGLECTSYWNRNDGCLGTPLDHVITSTEPSSIAARGPCESVGCDPGDRCPAFHREVSDHCPVTVELP